MKMKFMITAVVSVLAAANLFAAIPEPPKGHESDSCVRVSNVVAVKGNPCKVVFKDHDAMHPCEIVVYYDSEGKAFMETRERKQRRMNGRGDIVYRPEVNETFVGERGEYLWRYAEGFDNYGKKTAERETNNCELDRDKHFRYRVYSIDPIYCGKGDFDRHGNWTKGVQATLQSGVTHDYSRKIYYYGDNAAVEREVAEKKAYADSIVTKCKEVLPTASEKSSYNFRHNRGFFKNVLLPLLFGFLASFVPTIIMRPRRKISNLLIIIINLALLVMIWFPLAKILYKYGPYDHIFAVLYWFLLLLSYMFGYTWAIRGRCPRCASTSFSIIGEKVKTTTKTETAEFPDGHKEVLSRDTDREHWMHLQCNECGHTWWTLL